MVLPFNLSSDNQHGSSRSVIITPSAPPIEIEPHHGPYVDFLLPEENQKDKFLIRAERKAVLESSVELAKIINAGSTSGRKNDNSYIITNVDKYDFELVVRFLETKFIKFQDHSHVLRILELADRFNCPDLVIHCVKELDLQLSSLIVLDVFRSLWYYNNNSAPPPLSQAIQCEKTQAAGSKTKLKSSVSAANPMPFTSDEYLTALLNNCLQLIDMQAELILTKEQMSELRFEELERITKREALQMQSDIVLFICLADWSLEECKRKKLELNDENRRRVLGPLCYAPRYITMAQRDFKRACDRVELLDSSEIRLVNDVIQGKKLTMNLTAEQNAMLERFRTPRPAYAKLPIYLSDRTNPKNYSKKMRRADNETEDSCWSSFGLNCLSIFACILD